MPKTSQLSGIQNEGLIETIRRKKELIYRFIVTLSVKYGISTTRRKFSRKLGIKICSTGMPVTHSIKVACK